MHSSHSHDRMNEVQQKEADRQSEGEGETNPDSFSFLSFLLLAFIQMHLPEGSSIYLFFFLGNNSIEHEEARKSDSFGCVCGSGSLLTAEK